ncbi:hypothetical protein HY643_02040 [Candidatus Woesearchaeota archaeon]|nr:hypothetical protein [Candidatus Woesearchaeota archaeon]
MEKTEDGSKGREVLIELKKVLKSSLNSRKTEVVELGDVSKWEKIDPTVIIAVKTLSLDLDKKYLPILQNKEGVYTLIVGQYYKNKANEQGLKDVAENIEVLLQKPDTTLEQLELYAVHTFKNIPDKKSILKVVKEAAEEAKKIEQSLEQKINKESTARIMLETTKIVTKKLATKAGKLALKASYPILGNLPFSLQEKLEKKVGKENYNAANAAITSIVTNSFVGGASFFYYERLDPHGIDVPLSIMGGAILGTVDVLTRTIVSVCANREEILQSGSLPFEVACLPFKFISNTYKKSKEDLSNSYEEAKNKIEYRKRFGVKK